MRLSIRAKVFAGFAAVLVTFGLVAAFSVYQLHRIGVGLSLVSNTYRALTRDVARVETAYGASTQSTDRLAEITPHASKVAPGGLPPPRESDIGQLRGLLREAARSHPIARETVKGAKKTIGEARTAGVGPRDSALLDKLERLLDHVVQRYDEYQRIGASAGDTLDHIEELRRRHAPTAQWDSQLESSVGELKRVEKGLGDDLKDLESLLDDRIKAALVGASEQERQSLILVMGFSLIAVLIGVFVTALAHRILVPIRTLTDAVKDIGEGHFARELAVTSDDELAVLAGEFNAMARKLRDRERQLQEKTVEVLRAERLAAVGRLAAQITHEIRNPLSSLSLNAELLQERLERGIQDDAGRAEAHALLVAMSREVERLAEITEEYLRFARHPKPDFSVVDLNDAVDELVDFMAAELAAGGVVAVRELTAAPRVRADAGQLRQVLLNLVRNAREAAGPGGHVRLSTKVDDVTRVALLEIEDDGPGIPQALKSHLFEPFFSTKERGTGLGLAVVQQIVHEHGGEVTCHPVLPKGTRFVVSLPFAETAATRSNDAASARPPAAAGG